MNLTNDQLKEAIKLYMDKYWNDLCFDETCEPSEGDYNEILFKVWAGIPRKELEKIHNEPH
jgi:hypothetical protein